ncbi:MAG TPA: hypothetical protein VK158_03135 [Acidobacteriota bacterium]|nr:hypothetical protein [Acidobacteriota bacterium]
MTIYNTIAKANAVARRTAHTAKRSIEDTIESHGGVAPMLHNGARTIAAYAGKTVGTIADELATSPRNRAQTYETNAAKGIDQAVAAASLGVERIVSSAKTVQRRVNAEYATRRDKVVVIEEKPYKMTVDTKSEASAVRGYLLDVAPRVPSTHAGKHELLTYIAAHAVISTPQLKREKEHLSASARQTLTYLQ